MGDNPRQRTAKESFQEIEERLNLVQEAGEFGIWELDLKTGETWKSLRHDRIFGYGEILPRWAFAMFLDHVLPQDRQGVVAKFNESVSSGAILDFECRIRRTDGNVRWIWVQAKPKLDDRGKVVSMAGVVKDVTGRKRMEDALKKSEALLRETQELSRTGGWELDVTTGRIAWTEELYRIYGVSKEYDPSDILKDLSFYHPEDRSLLEKSLEDAREKGKPYDLELRFRNAKGEDRWVRTMVKPILKHGRVIKLAGNLMDITERKRAEQSLKENLQLTQALIENMASAVYFKDTDGHITFLNRHMEQDFCIPREKMLGKKTSDLLPPEIAGPIEANDREVIQSGQSLEIEDFIRFADGDRWFLTNKFPIRDAAEHIIGIGGISTDITGRKLAEQRLRESEERFRIMADSSPLVIWVMNAQGGIEFINSTFREFFGIELEQVLGAKWRPLVHPDDVDGYLGAYTHALEDRKPFYARARVRRADGAWRWIESFGTPWISPEGNLMGYVGNSLDITDRVQADMNLRTYRDRLEDLVRERTSELEASSERLKQEIAERRKAEDAIRRSEEQYRLVVENANEGIAIAQNGAFRLVNPKLSEMIGYSQEELLSKPLDDLIHPQDRQMVITRHRQRMTGKTPPDMYSFRIIDKEGRTKWLEINAVKISWQGRPATLNFLTDITGRLRMEEDRKKMEAQLSQTQKIEALGTFAGGIAHDLNNILYPIIINIEMLLADTEEGSDIHDTLKQILGAAYRQRDLVKQILAFSRRSEQKMSPVNVIPLLQETLSLLRSSLPSTIELRSHINAHPDIVMGDATEIQQIILNLGKNAAESLNAQKGVIDMGLTRTRLNPLETFQTLKPGDYLQITVRDNGRGMPSHMLDRLFEPFFTTKEVGKGIGMGHPVAHGIAQKLGGAITVESEPGRGSLLTVYLPAMEEQPRIKPDSEQERIKAGEKRAILLVDDEQIILSSMQRVLERSGYAVVSARSGQEAVELFEENPQRFQLVITDLTMPGIDGRELAKRILAASPGTPVILSTGYGDMITEQEAKSLGIRQMLLKPPSTGELRSVVHRVLEG
ncbi:MAG: PAS domain S-box protein [Deltaproteobacteria bacterium]|nr:PAS domain S-box protein [Deltaproteobacteria bacterium]